MIVYRWEWVTRSVRTLRRPLSLGAARNDTLAFMKKISTVFKPFSHRTLALLSIMVLHGCGEVKVVDSESTLARVDPLNEVVVIDTFDGSPQTLECLRIGQLISMPQVVLSDADRTVFNNALKAHLAPLNYPINQTCENSIQMTVLEYRVRDLLVASRLAIELNLSITDSSQAQVWSASYRLTENAGTLPLDPISAGFGIASAAQNSSQDAQYNGVYLSVRRLLRALPEHAGFATPLVASELPPGTTTKSAQENPISEKTFTEAMNLWGQEKFDDALTIMEGLYAERSKATLGYQYGLMLEATGKFDKAAEVYADTAVAQAKVKQPTPALKTLRRLQRLNESNQSRHDSELSRAVEVISQLLQR